MDSYGRILCFLDRSRYFFFQVAPQLYSRGWEDPVPDPLLLRKSGSAGIPTRDPRICSQELTISGLRGCTLRCFDITTLKNNRHVLRFTEFCVRHKLISINGFQNLVYICHSLKILETITKIVIFEWAISRKHNYFLEFGFLTLGVGDYESEKCACKFVFWLMCDVVDG
jgi:hypothetical protein